MIERLLIVAALAASFSLFAAGERSLFSRVKVDVTMEKPPVPSVSGTPRSAPRVVSDPQWLVVRVTFHPQRESGSNYNTYIDGVKMSVRALFPLSRTSSNAYGMFKGEQTLWTVCCDGKSHTAMMLIPPQLIYRYVYMGDGFSGGHALQRGSLRIEVSFTDSTGRELGKGYHGVPGNGAKQEDSFGRLAKRVPTQFVVDGAFWEREATPWRCMAPDQFDLVCPAGVKVPDVPVPQHSGNVVYAPGPRKYRSEGRPAGKSAGK